MRNGAENAEVVEDISFVIEETERPEMHLDEVIVRMEVIQDYVTEQNENMVMIEEFKDLMTYRCIFRE